jgi:hypothetical protein
MNSMKEVLPWVLVFGVLVLSMWVGIQGRWKIGFGMILAWAWVWGLIDYGYVHWKALLVVEAAWVVGFAAGAWHRLEPRLTAYLEERARRAKLPKPPPFPGPPRSRELGNI